MDALTRRYKLRDDIVRVRQVERGQVAYTYKVPGTQGYFRLDELQHAILDLFDGSRTLEEVVEAHNTLSPALTIDPEWLHNYVEGLRSTQMFEQTHEEKHQLVLERLRDRRRQTAESKGRFSNPLHIALSAWDPDRFFDRVLPYVRFFWTRGFLIVSALSILVMLGIWAAEWDRMRQGTQDLFTFQDKSGADLLQFFLILLVVGFFHESAHGLTCKHFGGHVHEMGFLFVYFTPCFFVEVSEAFLFQSHFKRQWVIYAGGYIELFMCSLATFVWALTAPGTLVNDVSYKFLLMTGLMSIVINYNPFIKLDGYYSLMDFLEISNLWESSFSYTSGWIKKNIFRLPVEMATPPRNVRRILVGYCLASVAYKVILLSVVFTFFRNIFVSLLGSSGYVLFALAVFMMLRKPLAKLVEFLRFALLDKKEVLMKTRTLVAMGSISAVLLGGFVLIPLPVVVRAGCTLESRSAAQARSRVAGAVERLFVDEGREVRQGEALARLRNDRVSRTLAAREARLALTEQEIAQASGRQDRAVLAKKTSERDTLREEVRALGEQADALTLRTPIAGTVVTPRIIDRLGIYLEEGGTLCEIAGQEGLIARVPVREAFLDEIRPGQRVRLKLDALPFQTISGRVIALAPASSEHDAMPGQEASFGRYPSREFTEVEAIVSVLSATGSLKAGMAGTAKIEVGRGTLIGRTARSLRRSILALIW